MSINSITFIFVFLPVFLVAYYVLPSKCKNVVLLLGSLLFYAWGNPVYLLLLLLSVSFNYVCALEIQAYIETEEQRKAKAALLRGIIFNVAVLGFFKYYGFVLENINVLLPKDIPIQTLPLPLGISFFTFSVISYLVDVYRKDTPAQKNVIAFGVYVAFFAKVISGPIVRYVDMEEQLKPHTINMNQMSSGATMFIRGLGKKVLIADNFGALHATIAALSADEMTVVTAWLSVLAYTIQIYFDFSGYSDMAIGIGRMFGFQLTQNFDYPYISKSITEFWRRWHMTLGTWFREYIYIPLGGNRVGTVKHIRNIMVVWMLTGIWHGAAWNFILWGLYYGVILLIEKYVLKDILQKVPPVVSHIYTMLLVMIGWTIFAAPSLGAVGTSLGQLVGIGCAGFINKTTIYFLKSNLLQLIFACLCSTPFVYKMYNKFAFKNAKGSIYISCVIYTIILLCSLAYLINATYQSFLYVQF